MKDYEFRIRQKDGRYNVVQHYGMDEATKEEFKRRLQKRMDEELDEPYTVEVLEILPPELRC